MGDCNMICNITKCRKELKTQGWVTSCSHIFCMEHGQNAADSEKCPACGQTFAERYDVVLMDLNPSEQHKSMVLTGLSPEKVLDIANRALMFWSYQMYQEKLYKESVIKSTKQHAADLIDFCESLNTKHKNEVQRLERNIEILQKEVEQKNKQIEDVLSQLSQKTKLNKHMQVQYDLLKRRTLTNYMSSSNEDPSSSPSHNEFEPKFPSTYDGNQRYHKNSELPYEQDTNFIFQPRI